LSVWISIIVLAVYLIINGVLASAASDIAADKGYMKETWFHMCFWLGPIAYVIVAAMPNKKLQKTLEAINAQLSKGVGEDTFGDHGDYVDAATQIQVTHLTAGKVKHDTQGKETIYAIKAKLSIGKHVSFGIYPQEKEGMDETGIEWLVLELAGNKALLISRYGLDALPYDTSNDSTTWENCTLRAWLNSTFINKAFTSAEQTSIVLTNVNNSNSQGYSEWNTDAENNTQDKIFLLSYAEVNKYFGVTYKDSNNTKARVEPTAYAIAQGAYTDSSYKTTDGKAAGYWWLRSPGYDQYSAAYVFTDGSLGSYNVHDACICVRPALWVNLESDIFQSGN